MLLFKNIYSKSSSSLKKQKQNKMGVETYETPFILLSYRLKTAIQPSVTVVGLICFYLLFTIGIKTSYGLTTGMKETRRSFTLVFCFIK